jgi:hypothetical protein
MYLNFKKNGKTSISTQKSRIQKLEEKNLDKKFFDGGFFFSFNYQVQKWGKGLGEPVVEGQGH